MMPESNIYKIFKSIAADTWVCTICQMKIQINPHKYNKLNPGKRQRVFETAADKHIATQHPTS